MRRGGFISRLFALLLLFAPFVVAAGMVAAPLYARWSAEGEAVRQFRAQSAALERENARIARIESIADEWAAFAADPGSGLAQEDLEAASAAALEWAAALFDRHEGALSASEVSEVGRLDGLETISLELRGELPAETLALLLAELESRLPFLIIDRMEAEAVSRDAQGAARLALTIQAQIYRLTEVRP